MSDPTDRRLRILPRRMAILFACGLIAIVFEALLFNYVTSSLADWTRDGIAIRGQIEKLDAAHDALVDVETAARGSLLTGRPENLQAYGAAASRAKNLLGELRAVPPADAGERAQVEQYDRLARSRLDELDRVVDAYRAGQRDRSLEATVGDRSKLEQILSIGGGLQAALTGRIEMLRARVFRILEWSKLGNAATAIVATAILIFFGLTTIQHLLRRHRLERRIQTSNIELEGAIAHRTRELE